MVHPFSFTNNIDITMLLELKSHTSTENIIESDLRLVQKHIFFLLNINKIPDNSFKVGLG
jgi:hypothetical protein